MIQRSYHLDARHETPAIQTAASVEDAIFVSPHETEASTKGVFENAAGRLVAPVAGAVFAPGQRALIHRSADGYPIMATPVDGTAPEGAPEFGFGLGERVLDSQRVATEHGLDLAEAKARMGGIEVKASEHEAWLGRHQREMAENALKLGEAHESLQQLSVRLEKMGAETPVALDAVRVVAERAQKAAAAAADASTQAERTANQAAQAALQAAGIADGKGKTIISASEPDAGDRRPNNVWIKPIGAAGSGQQTVQTFYWDAGAGRWQAIDDDGVKQAAQNALDARNAAEQARTEASAAKGAAATAQATAQRARSEAAGAKDTANQARTEAAKAPRVRVADSLSEGKSQIEQPYREGDEVIVGSGSPVQVSASWVYQDGAWRQTVLTADNIVVNQALWAKLVQAESGEFSKMLKAHQAAFRDMMVTNQATIENLTVPGITRAKQAWVEDLRTLDITAANLKAGAIRVDGNMTIDRRGVQVWSGDPYDEQSYPITRLSGDDQAIGVQATLDDGSYYLAGFKSTGAMNATSGTVKGDLNVGGRLTVCGRDICDELSQVPHAANVLTVSADELAAAGSIVGAHASNSWLKLAEVLVENPDDSEHIYSIATNTLSAHTNGQGTIVARLTFRVSNLDDDPASPDWVDASAGVDDTSIDKTYIDTTAHQTMSFRLAGPFAVPAGRRASIAIWVQGRVVSWSYEVIQDLRILTTDLGRNRQSFSAGRVRGWSTDRNWNGPAYDRSSPKINKREYSRVFRFGTNYVYEGGSYPTSNSHYTGSGLWQGRYRSSAKTLRSRAIIDRAIHAEIDGAELESARLYLQAGHVYYTGTPAYFRIGLTTSTGSYWQSSRQVGELRLGRGQGGWLDITEPIKRAGGIRSFQGITLNPQQNDIAVSDYGQLAIWDLHVTYRK